MTNSRMSRGAQFCESVVQAVFAESKKFEVNPTQVMQAVVDSFNNKVAAIQKANNCHRHDMLDAMMYVFQNNPSKFKAHNNSLSTGLEPTRILYSGNRTIVFWNDGDKTIVKCADGQEFDEYNGFVAALAKKLYGSTSKVKRIINKTKQYQE